MGDTVRYAALTHDFPHMGIQGRKTEVIAKSDTAGYLYIGPDLWKY